LIPEFLTSFEPAPGPALSLLNKLDVAFASLISGKNVESGTPMPGFEKGSVISMTEKVRIKSIVDQTRMVAVKVLGSDYDADYGYHDDEMFPAEGEEISPNMLPSVSKSDMRVAKVYQRTIGVLGKELGGTSPIGMITDD
jgi:Subunit 11 of the general transcription factor TFIIH